MKTTISALHFKWDSMEECLDRVKNEFHIDGVELSFCNGAEHPHCTKADIANVRRINEKFEASLYAHIWENPAKLDHEKAVESLLAWAECGQRTGVKGFVIHGGSYPDRKEGIGRVRRVFEKVLPAYEKAGIALCIENHYAYDYRNCQELFSEVWEFEEVFSLESPALKFCFDTGHGHLTKNTKELLTKLGRYLAHVHLADNHGTDDDHVPYKTGTVDWPLVWQTLKSIGFNGTFCVEFPVFENTAPFIDCLKKIQAFHG